MYMVCMLCVSKRLAAFRAFELLATKTIYFLLVHESQVRVFSPLPTMNHLIRPTRMALNLLAPK